MLGQRATDYCSAAACYSAAYYSARAACYSARVACYSTRAACYRARAACYSASRSACYSASRSACYSASRSACYSAAYYSAGFLVLSGSRVMTRLQGDDTPAPQINRSTDQQTVLCGPDASSIQSLVWTRAHRCSMTRCFHRASCAAWHRCGL